MWGSMVAIIPGVAILGVSVLPSCKSLSLQELPMLRTQCDTGFPILNDALTSTWSPCPHEGHSKFLPSLSPICPHLEHVFDVYRGSIYVTAIPRNLALYSIIFCS